MKSKMRIFFAILMVMTMASMLTACFPPPYHRPPPPRHKYHKPPRYHRPPPPPKYHRPPPKHYRSEIMDVQTGLAQKQEVQVSVIEFKSIHIA